MAEEQTKNNFVGLIDDLDTIKNKATCAMRIFDSKKGIIVGRTSLGDDIKINLAKIAPAKLRKSKRKGGGKMFRRTPYAYRPAKLNAVVFRQQDDGPLALLFENGKLNIVAAKKTEDFYAMIETIWHIVSGK